MKVNLKDLYGVAGYEIKKKIQKGDSVTISFKGTCAIGLSTIKDLEPFLSLKNVKFVEMTEKIQEQLGFKVSDMELYFEKEESDSDTEEKAREYYQPSLF